MIHMKHRCLFPAAVCGSLSIILIVLVRCVDVAPIGAEATNIGLSHLNGFVGRRQAGACQVRQQSYTEFSATDVKGFYLKLV